MDNPNNMYNSILSGYLKGQLFYSALELDIFSLLDKKISVKELVEITGYDEYNLHFFLLSLASENFIDKDGDLFVNTEFSKKYLSKNSNSFIAMSLLSKKDMLDISDAIDRVKNGKIENYEENKAFKKVYNFKSLAESSANEIKLFRAKPLIESVKNVFSKDDKFTFLDIGGGSGMLSIELCKYFKNAKGVIFEEDSVAEVAKDFIKKEYMDERICVKKGNFLIDGIGSGYDLIIASGIFNFAKSSLDDFVNKLSLSLNETGYLYSVTKMASEDYIKPDGLILKWLSSYFKRQDFLINGDILDETLKKYKFKNINDDLGEYNYVLYKRIKNETK